MFSTFRTALSQGPFKSNLPGAHYWTSVHWPLPFSFFLVSYTAKHAQNPAPAITFFQQEDVALGFCRGAEKQGIEIHELQIVSPPCLNKRDGWSMARILRIDHVDSTDDIEFSLYTTIDGNFFPSLPLIQKKGATVKSIYVANADGTFAITPDASAH